MSVVTDLEKGLVKLNNTSYNSIDKLMKKVAKDNDISATELHHKFKSKYNMIPDDWIKTQMQEGNLYKWFKGSKSKDGKSGWVNVVTGGTCASDKPGEGTPKCVSSSKRASMTPAERKSAQRRKKKADPNQQSKSGGAKPTYVSTDPKKKMKEEIEINEADKKGKGSGTKDACYKKVKASASVWPSAYASGRLVQCRKKGAANYGKSKNEEFMSLPEMTDLQINAMRRAGIEVEVIEEGLISGIETSKKIRKELKNRKNKEEQNEACWDGYTQKGMKKKGKKVVPNCVPVGEELGNGIGGGITGAVLNTVLKGAQTVLKNPLVRKASTASTVARPLTLKGDSSKNDVKEETIEEAVRIPAKTGNIYMVGFSWKGRYMLIKLFFPTVHRPSKKEVLEAIEKIYPGALVQRYDMAAYQPGESLLHVEEYNKSSKSCSKGEYYCNDSKKCKPIPKGYHVMPNGDLMKDEDHDEGEGGDVSEGASWTKKEGQNKSGGLNEKGRKSYEKENPGSDLKAPSKKVGNKRRSSFCARMKGMRKRQKPSNNTGEDRLSKSLRAWNC